MADKNIRLDDDVLAAVRERAAAEGLPDTLDVVPTDADDNRVLECALAAGSDVVVTGDTDLLTLERFRGIRILSPSDFLAEFRSSET